MKCRKNFWAAPKGKIIGAVLAGGTSRRYGKEKALLEWNGRSFLDIAASRLGKVCGDVVVSVDKKGRFTTQQAAREIEDVMPGQGAGVGILSVLRAHEGCAVLVTPVDMPLMRESTLQALLRARDWGASAVVLEVDGIQQPLVGVYEPEAAAVIEECLRRDERKLVIMTHAMGAAVVRPPAAEEPYLVNINSPGDFKRLQAGDL
ncbi:MAG: molybdenum cofactor guanylyltransferase [Pseudomonadota bacterium]